jgi:hypothetical protein
LPSPAEGIAAKTPRARAAVMRPNDGGDPAKVSEAA